VREFAGSYPLAARPTGQIRSFELVAAPADLPLIDGGRLKVWAYNGSVPGPTLRVRLGDTVRVRFQNQLPQATTVHWHGVRLPNAMDGVPYLTQPPVEPGQSFVYEFTPKDAGTFWFHPHLRSSEQVERGLYGVLIVEDAQPAPYARDLTWVLDDWLLDEGGGPGQERQIFAEFNTPHDLAHDGRWGNALTINGRTHQRLALRAGERVRLRLVNSANGRVFRLTEHLERLYESARSILPGATFTSDRRTRSKRWHFSAADLSCRSIGELSASQCMPGTSLRKPCSSWGPKRARNS